MSARLCVLGSGSSGNGSWLSLPSREGSFECFIDAGLSPKQTGERLRRRGLLPVRPRALVLTHADSDHWRPTWAPHVDRLELRVFARREHHAALVAAGVPKSRLEALTPGEPVELAPDVTIDSIATPHDEHGSTGLRFECAGGRVAWLTDLGRAGDEVIEFARGCELVAIESNYCPRLQLASRRPPFLKARIMGGKGHLSNEECLAAIEAMMTAALGHVVLLHLSRECNHAARIRELWLERRPDAWERVVVSSQATPTPVLTIGERPAPTLWPAMAEPR